MAEVIDNKATEKILRAEVNITRAIERRVLRRAAKLVQRKAKQMVPIGDPSEKAQLAPMPGWLKKHIKVRALKRRGNEQRIGIVVDIQDVPYAKVLEFGHKYPVKRMGKMVSMKRPQNFYIIKARDSEELAVRQEFMDAVREELYRIN